MLLSMLRLTQLGWCFTTNNSNAVCHVKILHLISFRFSSFLKGHERVDIFENQLGKTLQSPPQKYKMDCILGMALTAFLFCQFFHVLQFTC